MEVSGGDHGVWDGGGGEGDGEVELAKQGRHLAPAHQAPLRVLHQHVPEHDGDQGPHAGRGDRHPDEVPEDLTREVPVLLRGQGDQDGPRGHGQAQCWAVGQSVSGKDQSYH